MSIKQRALAAVLVIALPLVGLQEGRSLFAYLDPVGIPTICDGITKGVRLGQTATARECDARLTEELSAAITAVDRLSQHPQPDTRRAALGSFVFNVGGAQFATSTLLRKLNSGDVAGACAELSRWVYAKGKKLRGLERRRAAERELCEVGL